jgi:transposase
MRVSTALNRLLGLGGARVTGVRFEQAGVIVGVCLRRRAIACSGCGQAYRAVYDRQWRRWRHLDLAGHRLYLEYELRRVRCRDCGVRVEAVPWARTGARHTREFDDLAALLAQQMPKSQVQALLRIGWATVGRIVARVVADRLDERRLTGLVQIGIDEVSYRRGLRYITNVADHHSGRIVWSAPGRNGDTLAQFFELLGDRRHTIRAVSIDMSAPYIKAIGRALPAAEIVFDPFHVIAGATRALDEVRRAEWRAKSKSSTPDGRWIKHARWPLIKAPHRLTDRQRLILAQIQQLNHTLYRAYQLKEQLRALYLIHDPAQAAQHLDSWLDWAARSQLKPFTTLARSLRRYRHGILAAVRLGLTNARLEGLHNKARLLSHRSYGLRTAHALIALIYLCCAGITITPPHK